MPIFTKYQNCYQEQWSTKPHKSKNYTTRDDMAKILLFISCYYKFFIRIFNVWQTTQNFINRTLIQGKQYIFEKGWNGKESITYLLLVSLLYPFPFINRREKNIQNTIYKILSHANPTRLRCLKRDDMAEIFVGKIEAGISLKSGSTPAGHKSHSSPSQARRADAGREGGRQGGREAKREGGKEGGRLGRETGERTGGRRDGGKEGEQWRMITTLPTSFPVIAQEKECYENYGPCSPLPEFYLRAHSSAATLCSRHVKPYFFYTCVCHVLFPLVTQHENTTVATFKSKRNKHVCIIFKVNLRRNSHQASIISKYLIKRSVKKRLPQASEWEEGAGGSLVNRAGAAESGRHVRQH